MAESLETLNVYEFIYSAKCMTHYDEAFGNKKKGMLLMTSIKSGGYAV